MIECEALLGLGGVGGGSACPAGTSETPPRKLRTRPNKPVFFGAGLTVAPPGLRPPTPVKV